MNLKKMSIVDAGFLRLESPDMPMHIAGLEIFSLPPNAPEDFLERLVARFKSPRALRPPFNYRLQPGPLSLITPCWIVDEDVDLDYHVRHQALPRPGGERELGVLVSRLHTHRLNRRRPLWECHVIEGLSNKRFAIYFKMHHALVDGVSGRHLVTGSLSDSPDARDLPPFWAAREEPPRPKRPKSEDYVPWQETARGILAALKPLAAPNRGTDRVVLPFEAPMSQLNGRIAGTRRFATQQVEITRLKRIAKAHDATLNDVVLALCGGALRRYLLERDNLPLRGLVAGCPVSLRLPGNVKEGNAVGYLFATLGTNVADPARRFKAIRGSAKASKEHLQRLPRHVLMPYSQILVAPFFLSLLTGIAGRTKPPMNITISNVPGPENFKYFDGARLEASFPVSIPAHGQAVNITCLSYAGKLNFGFTGCRDTLPHLQRLAIYVAEALDELEAALLPTTALPPESEADALSLTGTRA